MLTKKTFHYLLCKGLDIANKSADVLTSVNIVNTLCNLNDDKE